MRQSINKNSDGGQPYRYPSPACGAQVFRSYITIVVMDRVLPALFIVFRDAANEHLLAAAPVQSDVPPNDVGLERSTGRSGGAKS